MTKNKCEDCDLAYRCDSNKLKGSGSKTSDIMLVFDNPSKADDQEGEIGIGDSGMKLNYYLQRAGLKKSDVYITSAIKCNTYKAADLKAAHAEACQKHLIAEILKIRPKLVVPMGRWAWQSLSGETSIGEFRGHFDEVELDYTYNGKPKTFKCNLLPTFSPSSCLTKWEWDDYVIHDLKKAKRFVKKGKKGLTPTPKWETILDTHGLDKFVDHYSKVDFCITDFETTGLDFWRHEIINAGYCAEKDFVTIVPFIKYPKEHTLKFDEENLARAAQINKFVGKHKSKIVKAMREVHRQCGGFGGHNLKFDAKFARYNKIPYRKVLHDSVIKDSVIDENKKHDLNSCMEYRGINYGAYDTTIWQWVGKTKKNKKPYTYIPPYEIEKYLAIDCAGAFRLDKKQNIELKEQKLYNFYFKRQMALTREMTRIEYKGHKMDRALMESDKKKVKALFEKNKKKILKIVGDEDFNPNSVDQVSKYMEENNYPFERLEIKEGKKGYSTNADSLMKFCRFKKWRTFPELILMNRSLTKNLGTYIENKDGTAGMMRFLDQNDFIHSNFNIHTPRTGRLSSSGPNFQNIPNPTDYLNVRQFFIPDDPSWCCFEADYKSLELWIIAWLSGDKNMLSQLRNGIDMHSWNTVRFGHEFGFLEKALTYEKFIKMVKYSAPDEWEKLKKGKKKDKIADLVSIHKEYKVHRGFTKALAFGLNYGKEASTFAKEFEKPKEEVEDFIDFYFEDYPSMYNWRLKQQKIALTKGIQTLPFTKRTRDFTSAARWLKSEFAENVGFRNMLLKKELGNQAMNFPVQGTANEVYTVGKLKVCRELRRQKMVSSVRLTIHDGLVGNGPKEEMKEVEKICHEQMTTLLSKGTSKEVKLEVDFDVKTRWYGDTVKYK
jgi:uracil-DNA glycosylase family 4